MKTLLSSALILGLLSFSTLGLVGCSDESSVKEKETITTPGGGKTTTTVEKKIESSGSNPPANSEGEKAEKK